MEVQPPSARDAGLRRKAPSGLDSLPGRDRADDRAVPAGGLRAAGAAGAGSGVVEGSGAAVGFAVSFSAMCLMNCSKPQRRR